MDWMEQSREMMQSWSDMQKKMWESWTDAAAGFGKSEENPLGDWVARWQEAMKQSMAVWEDLTRKMVETQAQWASSEAAGAFWPGKEKDMKKMSKIWVDQTTAMMKTWTVAQKTLWDNWFSVADNMAKAAQTPGGSEWLERWQTTARQSMDAWEALSRKTMETQADWFKGWMKSAEEAAGKKPESSTKEQ